MSHPDADCSSCVWNVLNKQKYVKSCYCMSESRKVGQRGELLASVQLSWHWIVRLASALLVNYGNCSLGASYLGRDETGPTQTWNWWKMKAARTTKVSLGALSREVIRNMADWAGKWNNLFWNKYFGVKTVEDSHCHFLHIVSAVRWNLSHKPPTIDQLLTNGVSALRLKVVAIKSQIFCFVLTSYVKKKQNTVKGLAH